jgi:Holliday junction resolvase RusA-like endonuclease
MATKSSKLIVGNVARPVEFFLPGAPLPAPRPRFRVIRTKSGGSFVSTYYDKKYATFLKDAPPKINDLLGFGVEHPALFTGPVKLGVVFWIERPKSTKRTTPRFDIDNYLKSIMDAMTHAGVWSDDDQVECVYARKAFAPTNAAIGTAVEVADATTH